MSSTQIGGLTTAQIGALSIDTLNNLSATQIGQLSRTQVQSLTTAQLNGLSATNLNALNPAFDFPNGVALDMAGNLWEWVEDWYHPSLNGAPVDGSAWVEPTHIARVIRGGSFVERVQLLSDHP